jgi:phosphatidylglycerol:prolipoprotein diacylglycerol transferase
MRPYIFRLPDFLGRIPDQVPLVGGTQLGGRPIFSYGVMLGISFLLGWIMATYFTQRLGGDRRKTQSLFLWGCIGAILGARLAYFIASAPDEFSLLNFFRFQEGGLVAYGGFLGGMLVTVPVVLALKADWWGTADGVAPVLALGDGITRIGCFLYGCDFGSQTTAAWALHFPQWSKPAIAQWIPGHAPAFSQYFHGRLDRVDDVLSPGVHPTQLMESVGGFAGFLLVMAVLPQRRFKGQAMLVFLAYYAVMRFVVELFRGDAIRGTSVLGLPLSTSEFISVGLVLFVLPAWWWLARHRPLCPAPKNNS